jgi:hypothetical protein
MVLERRQDDMMKMRSEEEEHNKGGLSVDGGEEVICSPITQPVR